jgi:hypothetical protein
MPWRSNPEPSGCLIWGIALLLTVGLFAWVVVAIIGM